MVEIVGVVTFGIIGTQTPLPRILQSNSVEHISEYMLATTCRWQSSQTTFLHNHVLLAHLEMPHALDWFDTMTKDIFPNRDVK